MFNSITIFGLIVIFCSILLSLSHLQYKLIIPFFLDSILWLVVVFVIQFHHQQSSQRNQPSKKNASLQCPVSSSTWSVAVVLLSLPLPFVSTLSWWLSYVLESCTSIASIMHCPSSHIMHKPAEVHPTCAHSSDHFSRSDGQIRSWFMIAGGRRCRWWCRKGLEVLLGWCNGWRPWFRWLRGKMSPMS